MGHSNGIDVNAFTDAIFHIGSEQEFNVLALELFHYQYRNNPYYRQYVDLLGLRPENISPGGIPFLPIEFFRDHDIVTGRPAAGATVFSSSGTTSSLPGRHIVPDTGLYERSFLESFRYFYGEPSGYCFLALLPGYLERSGSSLVHMMDHLVRMTTARGSGFYLDDLEGLATKLAEVRARKQKTILFGVSFALLDLAEKYPMDLEGVIIMETGGMKGRRKEMVREELHGILCSAFQVDRIHSEYGMTELMSQAYSKGEGMYSSPPWMKILTRDTNDPLSLTVPGETGGINIIDLANIHSCAFIATQDLGRLHENGSFEVLGRFDNSDIRGCNLMVT